MTNDHVNAAAQPPAPATMIAFLLDETGSMQGVRDATISGFNEYVLSVRNQHPDALLSLRLFSSQKYEKLTHLTPLPHVPKLPYDNYSPNGGTPLYDSIARLVREMEDGVRGVDPVPEVLFVIMTDGEENASREFNRERIFEMIDQKQKSGWTFVFLGANQDAWQVGRSIGVSPVSAMTYDADAAGMSKVMHMMGTATARHVDKRKLDRSMNPTAAPKMEEFFTDEDADELGKKRPPTDKK